jgi:hypothetical protein
LRGCRLQRVRLLILTRTTFCFSGLLRRVQTQCLRERISLLDMHRIDPRSESFPSNISPHPKIDTRVPLTSAFRSAMVTWGDCRMECSNSIGRGQVQSFPKWNSKKANKRPARQPSGGLIATFAQLKNCSNPSKHTTSNFSNRSKTSIPLFAVVSPGRAGIHPRRKRSANDSPTACACSPAQAFGFHSPLTGPELAKRVTRHCIPNRPACRLEIAVTPRKQSPIVISNRLIFQCFAPLLASVLSIRALDRPGALFVAHGFSRDIGGLSGLNTFAPACGAPLPKGHNKFRRRSFTSSAPRIPSPPSHLLTRMVQGQAKAILGGGGVGYSSRRSVERRASE